MKRLFIPLALLAVACTKSGYKPDHDQVSCKTFRDIREIWQDSAMNYVRNDTFPTFNDQLSYNTCDKRQLNDLTNFVDTSYGTWHKFCNAAGEVLHWEYWKPELK